MSTFTLYIGSPETEHVASVTRAEQRTFSFQIEIINKRCGERGLSANPILLIFVSYVGTV